MSMCKHDVTQDCPACAEETIAALKARIAELEANERAYEEIIGKKTYREVADELAATHQISPVSESAEDWERRIKEKVWASECLTAGEWVYLVGVFHAANEAEDRSSALAPSLQQSILKRLCEPETGHTIHDVVANYRAIRRDALSISSTVCESKP